MTQMAEKSDRALSNLEYDLITALQNKAEAVKAYETYIQDAQQMDSQPCVQLFQKLREQDQQTAQEIRHHLQQVMQNGKM
ncbi:MAG: hypothetical protein MUC48_06890 [Leptolyngbya sp. Prado105]|jgi:ferritin-like metal-binding protein YciE|nr:hypothetical protein [Leptolyngbya sp. Prado105]